MQLGGGLAGWIATGLALSIFVLMSIWVNLNEGAYSILFFSQGPWQLGKMEKSIQWKFGLPCKPGKYHMLHAVGQLLSRNWKTSWEKEMRKESEELELEERTGNKAGANPGRASLPQKVETFASLEGTPQT